MPKSSSRSDSNRSPPTTLDPIFDPRLADFHAESDIALTQLCGSLKNDVRTSSLSTSAN